MASQTRGTSTLSILDVDVTTTMSENLLSTSKGVTVQFISKEVLLRFHTIMVTFWYIICVSGITSNVINIRTFLRMGLEDGFTVSLFFLAVSDFGYCSFAFIDLSFWLANLISRLHGPFYFFVTPMTVAFFCVWIRKAFLATSILITTYLAVQRCLCVVLPFHVSKMFTRTRTYGFLVVIFTFAATSYLVFLINHPVSIDLDPVFNSSHLVIHFPKADEPVVIMAVVGVGLGLNLACMMIVVLCLIGMATSLKKSLEFRQSAVKQSSEAKSDKNGGQEASKNTPSKETRALTQVALVSLIFVTTNLPLLAYGITHLIVPELSHDGAYGNLYQLCHNIMYTTELMNSSVNLIVYYKYNTKYHKLCGFGKE